MEMMEDAGYLALREKVYRSLSLLKDAASVAEAASGISAEAARTREILEILELAARNRLAAEIAVRLLNFAADLGARDFLEEYRRRSLVLGKAVTFTRDGGERRALAVGIGENGELIVRYDDGREEALNAGEVRLLPGAY